MKLIATHTMHVIASATKRAAVIASATKRAAIEMCPWAACRALSASCDKTVLAVPT